MQSVFNIDALRHVIDGNSDLEKMLITLFQETAQKNFEQLKFLAINDPLGKWQDVLRELKDAADSLHINELAGLCGRFNDVAFEQRRSACDELQQAYSRFLNASRLNGLK